MKIRFHEIIKLCSNKFESMKTSQSFIVNGFGTGHTVAFENIFQERFNRN